MPTCYRFGDYQLLAEPLALRHRGQAVEASTQVLQLLLFLVQRPGEMVEKAALLEAIWGHSHLTDAAYARAIMRARQAVGDDGRSQSVIRTAHGRGVMWVAPVEVEDAASERVPESPTPVDAVASSDSPSRNAGNAAGGKAIWLIATLTILMLAIAAATTLRRQPGTSVAESATPAEPREYSLALLPFKDPNGAEDQGIVDAVPSLLEALLARDGIRLLQPEDGDAEDWQPDPAALKQKLGVDAVLQLDVLAAPVGSRLSYRLLTDRQTEAGLQAATPLAQVRELADLLRRQLSGVGSPLASPGWIDDPLLGDLIFRAQAAWARGRREDALQALDAALAMRPEDPDLVLQRLEISGADEQPARALRELLQWSQQHRDDVPPMLLARALERAGTQAWYAGESPLAIEILEQAQSLVDPDKAPMTLALIRNALSMAQQSTADHRSAWENAQLAVDALRRDGHAYHLAFALTNLGYLAEEWGRVEAADRHQREALELRQRHGFKRLLGSSLYAVARTARRNGRLDEALELIHQAQLQFETFGLQLEQVDALEEETEITLLRGDPARAESTLDRASAMALQNEDALAGAWLDEVRGRLRLTQGHADEAVALIRSSIEVQLAHGEAHEADYSRLSLVEALGKAGHHEEADVLFAELESRKKDLSPDQQVALSVLDLRRLQQSNRLIEALAACDATLELARLGGTRDREAEAAIICGQLHLANGNVERAQRMLALAQGWNADVPAVIRLREELSTAPDS